MKFIRLETSLLDDDKILRLAPEMRLTFILLLLTSARHHNKILRDASYIKKICHLYHKPDLDLFESLGLIEPFRENDCVKSAADSHKNVRIDKIRRDKKRIDERRIGEEPPLTPPERSETSLVKPDGIPDFAKIWNENRGNLPFLTAMTQKRRSAWVARWSEKPDEAYWVGIVTRAASTPFLSGSNDRGWRANVDFVLRPDSHVKIDEGFYENKTKNKAENRFNNNVKVMHDLFGEGGSQ